MHLRILHRFDLPETEHARLLAESRATREIPGCLESEAYRGLREPEQVAVVQLWESEDAHDAYAAAVADGRRESLPAELAADDRARTEIYRHEYTRLADGAWTADSQVGGHRVVWPSAGAPIRILIQSCYADVDAETPVLLSNERASLRELGCEEFAWMRGLDDDRHVLLLELWSDPHLYDQHWSMRRRTQGAAPTRVKAERSHGQGGAEFYRASEFQLQYGHWLPAHQADWASAVVWPA